MQYRMLLKNENDLLGEINRAEVVEKLYKFSKGQLILEDVFYDIKGWNPRELNEYISILNDICDRGGTVYGAFDGTVICGLGALDSKFYGKHNNYLKLDKLYISKDYRGRGIGKEIVKTLSQKAKEMGATKLYVSATPFENTVNFYIGVGCELVHEYIEELQALEPEDIHLELRL